MMRVRFPLLVLLGTVFLASVCVSLKVREDENNPFYFRSSNSFQTLFENQNGRIRLLQRFNKRSPQLENLRDYRIVQFQSKPNTILLPHHADADFLLFVLSGLYLLKCWSVVFLGHWLRNPKNNYFYWNA